MKKLLCALMALTAWAASVRAADGITIADANVPKGGTAVVEVQLNSTDKSYGGFQFDVTLPVGVTLVKVEKAARLTAIENYTLQKNLTDAENNIYTVLGYNTDRQSIAGTSGAVAYLTLEASTSMTIGNVLNATVKNVVLSTINEENIDAANSSFTITIGEPGDNRTILDETSTSVPAASSGAVDVRVKRTINANEWGTLVLPFAMSETQVKAAFGNDVQLAEYVDHEMNNEATSLTVNFEEANLTKDGLMANYPYIIKVSKDITEFTVDGVTINPDEDGAFAEFTNGRSGSRKEVYGTFKGTYHAQTVVPQNCLFLSENKFWYSTGATKMKGFRAYFDFVDKLASISQASSRITMSVKGGQTGIRDYGRVEATDDRYYDLQGRRVVKPAGGLYIKGGKKVIVK